MDLSRLIDVHVHASVPYVHVHAHMYCVYTKITCVHMCPGIFSPLDPQLVTPPVAKVTAAIPPTVRTTPVDSAHSGQPQNTVVNQSQISTSGGGIFSPLDSGQSGQTSFRQLSAMPTGATPAVHGQLDASLNLSAVGAPPPLTSTGGVRFSGHTPREEALPPTGHPLEHRLVVGE